MRSLVALDSVDLRTLACPWCGRTPHGATGGFKAVRDGEVVGALAFAPGSDLGGMYPATSVVVLQLWVRREDLGELIGTQLVHRLAAAAPPRIRCVIAGGTHGAGDCRHLPAPWLEGRGFDEAVVGAQWKLDLRRTVRVPGLVRGLVDGVGRLVRPARPAAADRRRLPLVDPGRLGTMR
ncbi:MAG: hypothetical protein Q4F65_02800 [Propionibacteriaceae bacterium]|nr:hypothetical protein [Propionibacteriaceae bacterium]